MDFVGGMTNWSSICSYFAEDELLSKLRLEMQSVHSPSSFGRIMFEIWKVATEAQFEWFTNSFQEEMQRRIPQAFEEALSVFSTLCDVHEA